MLRSRFRSALLALTAAVVVSAGAASSASAQFLVRGHLLGVGLGQHPGHRRGLRRRRQAERDDHDERCAPGVTVVSSGPSPFSRRSSRSSPRRRPTADGPSCAGTAQPVCRLHGVRLPDCDHRFRGPVHGQGGVRGPRAPCCRRWREARSPARTAPRPSAGPRTRPSRARSAPSTPVRSRRAPAAPRPRSAPRRARTPSASRARTSPGTSAASHGELPDHRDRARQRSGRHLERQVPDVRLLDAGRHRFDCSIDNVTLADCGAKGARQPRQQGVHQPLGGQPHVPRPRQGRAGERSVDARAHVAGRHGRAGRGARQGQRARAKARCRRSTPRRSTSPRTRPATFQCRLDGADFADCAAPITLEHLKAGQHRFEVRAIDQAGNIGAAAARTWSVAANDDDNDGFNAQIDCNDADPAIRPGRARDPRQRRSTRTATASTRQDPARRRRGHAQARADPRHGRVLLQRRQEDDEVHVAVRSRTSRSARRSR